MKKFQIHLLHWCIYIVLFISFVSGTPRIFRDYPKQQVLNNIIDNYIEAIGGREAWSKLITKEERVILYKYPKPLLIATGSDLDTVIKKSVIFLNKKTSQLKYKRYDSNDGFCLDGQTYFHFKDGEFIESSEYTKYMYSACMMGVSENFITKKTEDNLEYYGELKMDTVLCDVIKFKRKEWLRTYLYYFSKHNGLLIASQPSPEDDYPLINRTMYYNNYRTINGIKMHTEELSYEYGQLVSRAIIDAKFNVEVQDSIKCN